MTSIRASVAKRRRYRLLVQHTDFDRLSNHIQKVIDTENWAASRSVAELEVPVLKSLVASTPNTNFLALLLPRDEQERLIRFIGIVFCPIRLHGPNQFRSPWINLAFPLYLVLLFDATQCPALAHETAILTTMQRNRSLIRLAQAPSATQLFSHSIHHPIAFSQNPEINYHHSRPRHDNELLPIFERY